ncbi:MraY family glycosyltransferase [Effusibacillus dendaii]|uniref:Glycosyl transferase n=1 Tax=Effusibacillus dendaii TaxID=2743772 RepID=A0A7I8D789_9BACL|nr:hypothetical protein [Effusibacillus dendaii]BCJ85857.1 glycosyl transferase [Effusibacillus dendaii]
MAYNMAGWIGCLTAAAGFTLGAGFTRMLLPPFCRMLEKSGCVRPNYRGERISTGSGAVLILAFLLTVCLLVLFEKWSGFPALADSEDSEPMLVLAFGMGFLGILDDTVGSREASGLKGHVMKWIRHGELTTGLLKAVGGTVLSFLIVMDGVDESFRWSIGNLLSIVVDGCVIALLANWINLLDVRPGRALKGAMGKLILLLFAVPSELTVFLLAIFGTMVAYLPADIRARTMMGDAGSNFLGAMIGYLVVRSFDLPGTVTVLTALLAVHLYTEKHSLTRVIERTGWLNWLDRLGRKDVRMERDDLGLEETLQEQAR